MIEQLACFVPQVFSRSSDAELHNERTTSVPAILKGTRPMIRSRCVIVLLVALTLPDVSWAQDIGQWVDSDA